VRSADDRIGCVVRPRGAFSMGSPTAREGAGAVEDHLDLRARRRGRAGKSPPQLVGFPRAGARQASPSCSAWPGAGTGAALAPKRSRSGRETGEVVLLPSVYKATAGRSVAASSAGGDRDTQRPAGRRGRVSFRQAGSGPSHASRKHGRQRARAQGATWGLALRSRLEVHRAPQPLTFPHEY